MYTIYDHPLDIPTGFVVREWLITGNGAPMAGELLIVSDTVEGAREVVPPGLYCLGRQADDDPAVVETWV
jgi:hypothetical protein